MMAMLWAQQIMLGKKTFADVPRLLKDKVKEPHGFRHGRTGNTVTEDGG